MNACGLSYSGRDKDGKPVFDKFFNAYILDIEFASSPAYMFTVTL